MCPSFDKFKFRIESMKDDFNKVCQLLTKPPVNSKLALEILKGQPELKKQVEVYFRPLLDLYKKKKIN